MIIRREEPKDYPAVYELVKAAFATLPRSDGSEAGRVNECRSKSHFIPELTLVAEENGEVVGQILLHKMVIEYTDGTRDEQVEVAPLAVRPDRFKCGIGQALLEEGCKRAKELGYSTVFLCGHPTYYPRFGFVPTHRYNIYHVLDQQKNAPWCMVRELVPGYLGAKEARIDIE